MAAPPSEGDGAEPLLPEEEEETVEEHLERFLLSKLGSDLAATRRAANLLGTMTEETRRLERQVSPGGPAGGSTLHLNPGDHPSPARVGGQPPRAAFSLALSFLASGSGSGKWEVGMNAVWDETAVKTSGLNSEHLSRWCISRIFSPVNQEVIFNQPEVKSAKCALWPARYHFITTFHPPIFITPISLLVTHTRTRTQSTFRVPCHIDVFWRGETNSEQSQ